MTRDQSAVQDFLIERRRAIDATPNSLPFDPIGARGVLNWLQQFNLSRDAKTVAHAYKVAGEAKPHAIIAVLRSSIGVMKTRHSASMSASSQRVSDGAFEAVMNFLDALEVSSE